MFASILLKKLPEKITNLLYFGQKDSHIRAVPEDALTKRFNKFQNIDATGMLLQKIKEKKNKKTVQNEDPYSKEEAERLDRDDRA
jgi:cellobiose-specific phosphotransferase system component IIB